MSAAPPSGSTTYERMELAGLRQRAAALAQTAAQLGRALMPFYQERGQLRDKLMCTHETRLFDGRRCVVAWVRETGPDRVPLFAALDALNQKWAPQVNELRIVNAQLREANSQIKKLAEWIAKRDRRAH